MYQAQSLSRQLFYNSGLNDNYVVLFQMILALDEIVVMHFCTYNLCKVLNLNQEEFYNLKTTPSQIFQGFASQFTTYITAFCCQQLLPMASHSEMCMLQFCLSPPPGSHPALFSALVHDTILQPPHSIVSMYYGKKIFKKW